MEDENKYNEPSNEVERVRMHKERNEILKGHLQACAKLLDERGEDYGHDVFIDAAQIASVLLQKPIIAPDVCAVILAIKLSRYAWESIIKVREDAVIETQRDAVNYILLMDRERRKYEGGYKTKVQKETEAGNT